MNTATYSYSHPLWAHHLIRTVFFVVGLLFGFLAHHYDTLFDEGPAFLEYFLWILCGAFMLFLFHPSNRRPQPEFTADARGLLFPDRGSVESLFVPWEHVGKIEIGLVDAEWDGITIELDLPDEEITRYFRTIELTRKFHLLPVRNEDNYLVVGFANMFINRKKCVGILNEMKKMYGKK